MARRKAARVPLHPLAAAISGGAGSGWASHRVDGTVLYLQLDNPRSTWADRFEKLTRHGLNYTPEPVLVTGELEHFPFDILQPTHMDYLKLWC